MLLSTHQLDEAEALADRIAVLQRTLLAIDTPDGLRRQLAGPSRVVIEVDGDAAPWAATVAGIAVSVEVSGRQLDLAASPGHDVPDLVATLVAAGARVRSVRAARPSLEAAYLSLVRRDG